MLKPIGDRILVKKITMESKTKSGIILNNQEENSEILKAKVIEVSDEVKNIKISDIVYFSKFKGVVIEEYMVLEVKDILAKEIANENN